MLCEANQAHSPASSLQAGGATLLGCTELSCSVSCKFHSPYVFQYVSVPVTGFPPAPSVSASQASVSHGWLVPLPCSRPPFFANVFGCVSHPPDHTRWPGNWPGRRLPSSKRYRLVTIRSSHLRVSTSPSASALLPPLMVPLLLPHRHWHSCRCQCFRT